MLKPIVQYLFNSITKYFINAAPKTCVIVAMLSTGCSQDKGNNDQVSPEPSAETPSPAVALEPQPQPVPAASSESDHVVSSEPEPVIPAEANPQPTPINEPVPLPPAREPEPLPQPSPEKLVPTWSQLETLIEDGGVSTTGFNAKASISSKGTAAVCVRRSLYYMTSEIPNEFLIYKKKPQTAWERTAKISFETRVIGNLQCRIWDDESILMVISDSQSLLATYVSPSNEIYQFYKESTTWGRVQHVSILDNKQISRLYLAPFGSKYKIAEDRYSPAEKSQNPITSNYNYGLYAQDEIWSLTNFSADPQKVIWGVDIDDNDIRDYGVFRFADKGEWLKVPVSGNIYFHKAIEKGGAISIQGHGDTYKIDLATKSMTQLAAVTSESHAIDYMSPTDLILSGTNTHYSFSFSHKDVNGNFVPGGAIYRLNDDGGYSKIAAFGDDPAKMPGAGIPGGAIHTEMKLHSSENGFNFVSVYEDMSRQNLIHSEFDETRGWSQNKIIDQPAVIKKFDSSFNSKNEGVVVYIDSPSDHYFRVRSIVRSFQKDIQESFQKDIQEN